MEVLYQLSYVGAGVVSLARGGGRRAARIVSPGAAPDRPPRGGDGASVWWSRRRRLRGPLDKLAGGLDELARGEHPWAKPSRSVGRAASRHRARREGAGGRLRERRGARPRRRGCAATACDVEAVSGRAPQRMVEGWLPVSALDDVAALDSTRAVVPVYEPVLNTGSVTSEGDAAHRGPQARALGPTGAGIPVGDHVRLDQQARDRRRRLAGHGRPAAPTSRYSTTRRRGPTRGARWRRSSTTPRPGFRRSSSRPAWAGRRRGAAHIDALVAAGAKVIADDV